MRTPAWSSVRSWESIWYIRSTCAGSTALEEIANWGNLSIHPSSQAALRLSRCECSAEAETQWSLSAANTPVSRSAEPALRTKPMPR